MNAADVGMLALNSLIHRRLRSWLTVLGIVIGVGAVIALVSLGEGFQEEITSQLEVLGSDLITVSPGAPSAEGRVQATEAFDTPSERAQFSRQEVQAVRSLPGVRDVNGIVADTVDVTFRGETAKVAMRGMDVRVWPTLETRALDEGRFLVQGDRRAAVVTGALTDDFFRFPVGLNQEIEIEGVSVRVVGILESQATFGLEDTAVYVPADLARDILGVQDQRVSQMQVRTVPSADVGTVADSIEDRLLSLRKLTEREQDFSLLTGKEIQEEVESITDTFTAFLGGIAAIALLVGGIGIANTMFMSVMERSRQIGILKALGATRAEIAGLFLAESSLLGLVGGVFGVLLGYALAWLFTNFNTFAFGPPGADPPAVAVSLDLVGLGLGFAVAVGSVFGLLPAWKASRLAPVETMRAE